MINNYLMVILGAFCYKNIFTLNHLKEKLFWKIVKESNETP